MRASYKGWELSNEWESLDGSKPVLATKGGLVILRATVEEVHATIDVWDGEGELAW